MLLGYVDIMGAYDVESAHYMCINMDINLLRIYCDEMVFGKGSREKLGRRMLRSEHKSVALKNEGHCVEVLRICSFVLASFCEEAPCSISLPSFGHASAVSRM